MKISEKRSLEVRLDHSDIMDAILERVLDCNPGIAADWDSDEIEVQFHVVRNLAGDGGVELRAILRGQNDSVSDDDKPSAEPVMPDNEKVREGEIAQKAFPGDTEGFGGSDFPDI